MNDLAAALTAVVRDAVEGAVAQTDPRGALISLRDGWGPLSGSTLRRWARVGRLKAFTAERGRFVAWESDIRDAVETEPYLPATAENNDCAHDEATDLLAAADLELRPV